jgi:Tol biopolymer transport system component
LKRLFLVAITILCVTALPGYASEFQLTESPGDCRNPAWCSNGHISFSSDRYGLSDIWGMDEGGEAINTWRITQNPANTDYEPSWNAGCSHVYFSGSTGGGYRLYYISSVGAPAQPIAVSLGTGNDRSPDHSPGAGAVVFYSDRAGNNDIMWMPEGGESSSTYLTTNAADDRDPSWSPTGADVAFASDRSGNWDIWVMDAGGEGSGISQLTSNGADETHPAFNPGGDLVAFHRDGVGIVAIDVASRLEYQITTDPTDTEPCWSSSGMEIAFARESAGEYHIWMTNNVPDTPVEDTTWGRVKALYR